MSAVIQPSRGLSGHRLCAHLTVKPYAGVGCVSSTAAKYSSGATLRRYVGSPGASLTCSAPVGDILARGSGRRGRRFKSCHPDCIPAGHPCRPSPELVRASRLPVQQQNTASTATKTRIDLRIEGTPTSLRCASRVAIGTSVRIDLQRHRHVCVTQVPHDHPRVDFQIHQQRCAGPPRIVNRHVAEIGLVASSSKAPVEGPWIVLGVSRTVQGSRKAIDPLPT